MNGRLHDEDPEQREHHRDVPRPAEPAALPDHRAAGVAPPPRAAARGLRARAARLQEELERQLGGARVRGRAEAEVAERAAAFLGLPGDARDLLVDEQMQISITARL